MEPTNNSEQKDKPFLVVKPAIKTPLLMIESFFIALIISFFFSVLSSVISVFFSFSTTFNKLNNEFMNSNNFNPETFTRPEMIMPNLGLPAFVFLVSLIVFTFIVFSLMKARLRMMEYRFYPDRVEYFEGFLVRNRKVLSYDKISNLGVREGIIERMFGLGTIFIDTAGYSRTGYELAMHNLENPNQIYEQLSKLITKK